MSLSQQSEDYKEYSECMRQHKIHYERGNINQAELWFDKAQEAYDRYLHPETED